LLVLICLYGGLRLFAGDRSAVHNSFSILIVVFLLSQFVINNFCPESPGWWFLSIPGLITLMTGFLGLMALISYRRARPGGRIIDLPDQTFSDSIVKILPGIVVVGTAVFLVFLLNIDEISPRWKSAPDYSMYLIVALGFVLFFSLDFLLENAPFRQVRRYLNLAAVGVASLLAFIGGTKAYKVYVLYDSLTGSRAQTAGKDKKLEAKWREIMELNRIPEIGWISMRAVIELGRAMRDQGNFLQASRYYKEALASDAFNFEANLGLAETAFAQGKWRQAWVAYERVIRLRRGERRFYPLYLHACVKDGSVDKALEFITRVREPSPLPLYAPEDYLAVGDAFFKAGRLGEAIGYLQKSTELTPGSYTASLLLGRAYLESGQYIVACEFLERALRLNPTAVEAYYYLGVGYERSDQKEKACTIFERLVSMDPRYMKGLSRLQRLYSEMGRKDKAAKVADLIEDAVTRVVERTDWKGRAGEHTYRNGDMYWTGTVSAPVLLKEGKVKFILQAKGSPAKGIWPHMVVRLDDEIIGEVYVTSEELRNYEFEKAIPPGNYHLRVSFLNDGGGLDKSGRKEDRNLFVRKCLIVYED